MVSEGLRNKKDCSFQVLGNEDKDVSGNAKSR